MAAEGDRRKQLLQLASATVFLAIVGVAVLIVVASSSSGGDTNLEGKAKVSRLLAGIPQDGLVLGNPRAPVKLVEFGDLQCPVCRGYSEEILPPIVESRVRNGEVKIDFRNYTIIGEQSAPAGAAALAAGEQGRGWNYVELFYRNQGEENSGYADDRFLRVVAEGAGVKNIAKWQEERQKLVPEVEKSTRRAQELGLDGTPSFAIWGPKTSGVITFGTPQSTGAIEEAIEKAR